LALESESIYVISKTIVSRMHSTLQVLGILTILFAVTFSANLTAKFRNKRQSSGGYADNRKVVCYYANWAVYRQGNAQFTPQNINPYLCTHLIYAFGGLGKDDKIVPFDKYQDIEKGGYGRFAALKTYNRDLKTMLAIGGWNEGSRKFSRLVADPERRYVFVRSALRFLRQYNFDGLDLDWEYPTQRQGGRPQDKKNYAILVAELREAFESEAAKTGKERLLLSMAVPASLEIAGEGYAIDALDKSLDFFNLLTYDYHSAHEPAVNHHSPLYRPDDWSEFDFRTDLNIDATIKFYLQNGASRNKLVLGIPTYGRSFTLANSDSYQIDSPATGPGDEGVDTKEAGYLAYYEICNKILDGGWDLETPYPGVMGPYAHKGNQWVGFDDVDMVVEKAFYVADEELGGIMFWTIDNDDFNESCGETPFPLIESAKEAMYSVQPSGINTIKKISPPAPSKNKVAIVRPSLPIKNKPVNVRPSLPSKNKIAIVRPSLPRQNKISIVRPSLPQRQDSPRSLYVPKTTPAPPTTPRSGPVFKCTDEGFFAHATNCRKYYWCLDTPSQGMIANKFTCAEGLYFNKHTDSCDFLKNVDCGDKKIEDPKPDKSDNSLEDNSISDSEEDNVEDPKSLKDILEIVKAAGGVDQLEKQIVEDEVAKKKEDDRRVRISSKTRSRLSQLLNRDKSPKQEKEIKSKVSSPVFIPETTVKVKQIQPVFEPKQIEEEPKKDERDNVRLISPNPRSRLSLLLNRARPPKPKRREEKPEAPKLDIIPVKLTYQPRPQSKRREEKPDSPKVDIVPVKLTYQPSIKHSVTKTTSEVTRVQRIKLTADELASLSASFNPSFRD